MTKLDRTIVPSPVLLALMLLTGTSIAQHTSGYELKETDGDLQVLGTRGAPLSLQNSAQVEWQRITEQSGGQQLSADVTYRVLSLVGRYMSIEKEIDCDCGGAHPVAVKSFETLDLASSSSSKPRLVSLDVIFPPATLLAALEADKLVVGALQNLQTPRPVILGDLLEALHYQSVRIGECSYTFGDNLLTHFAFNDVSGDRVAVRIGLSHESEECRGQLAQLGISLPIPPPLRPALTAARSGRSGFLMARTAKDPSGHTKSFHFFLAGQPAP
jgi:hypothetical protein